MRSKQRLHVVVHVGLTHLHSDALAERGTERDLIEQTAIDAGDRESASFAHRLDRLAQNAGPVGFEHQRRFHFVVDSLKLRRMRLKSDGIDAGIWPDAARQILQRCQHADIFLGVIHRDRPDRSSQFQPFGKSVNGNHARRAEHERAGDGELPDGPATPYRDRVVS